MNKLAACVIMGLIAAAAVACDSPATDAELTAMCENLMALKSEGNIPTEAELIAKVEEDFEAREKKLLDWKAKDLAGWDKELEAKLEKAESDEEKKTLEEEYAKKKKVTAEQFEPDIAKLVPDKKAAIEAARQKVVDLKAEADAELAKCIEDGRKEGINQRVAKCRAEAKTTDKYWNFCL